MSLRYTEMSLAENGAYDFVARDRMPTASQIFFIVLSATLIGFSLVVSAGTTIMMLATVMMLFAIIGCYMIFTLMRSRDILLATEFQNSMFAAAMGLHNKFSLIIRRNGAIVYIDQSFQTLFPNFINQHKRTIQSLLKHARVPATDGERVQNALDQGTYEKVVLDITDAAGKRHHIILAIEPILRPAGFIMLRGREYVEHRGGSNDATSKNSVRLFDQRSISIFSDAMEQLKMGLYMTSPTGHFIYCNPLLESWLGYNEGEIVERNLHIANLISSQREAQSAGKISDIEGVVQMTRKVGGFTRSFVNQKIIYDNNGHALGATAVVHLYRQKDPQDHNHDSF